MGQAAIDSMLPELGKAREDTNKVKLLHQLSLAYRRVSTDEGIKYGEQALDLATKLNWEKGKGRADEALGLNYQSKSDLPKALQYLQQALNVVEKRGDKNDIAIITDKIGTVYFEESDFSKALNYSLSALKIGVEIGNKNIVTSAAMSVGNVYNQQSNFPKAIEYYLLALKVAEERGDKEGIAIITANIGVVYSAQEDYPKALEYYFRALKMGEETGDKYDIAMSTGNIGTAYHNLHNYSQALEYGFKQLKIEEELGDEKGIVNSTGDIGDNYASLHDYIMAITYEQHALDLAKKIGDKDLLASQLEYLGFAYLSLVADTSVKPGKPVNNGEVPESIYRTGTIAIPAGKAARLHRSIDYLQQGVAIGKEIDAPDLLEKCYNDLTQAYELAGDYKKALESSNNFIAIKDSIFSKDNGEKIVKMDMKYQYDRQHFADSVKTDAKEKIAAVRQQKQTLLNITLAIGLVIGVLVIALIVKSYRRTIEKNAELSEQKKIIDGQNKELGKTIREKDLLMKEIHHRVKNNLQVISTLLDTELTNISDAHAKDAMTESTTRVRSISLIHQQLYQNENITTIEFSRFAKDLLHQVRSVFNKNGLDVVLQNQMPETILDIDTAVPLGLILNELMTNSYKYAFINSGQGKIEINLLQKEGHYELTYKDSGPGLPKDMDLSALKSMGMQLIRNLSKQIGGKTTYVAEHKTFMITFKDEAGRQLTD